MDKNYKYDYEKRLGIVNKLLEKSNKNYEKNKEKYEKIKEDNNSDEKLNIYYNILKRNQYAREILENELKYIRCGNDNTEQEKKDVIDNFERKFKEIVNNDPKFFFHGCKSLAFVKEIIESGEISSGASRKGIETSFDTENVISVTGYDNMSVTLEGYCGLIDGGTYTPPGALFILKTDDYSNTTITAKPVFLKSDNDTLVAILSTSENKELIQNWLKDNGYDTNKFKTYNEFIEKMKDEKENDDFKSNLKNQVVKESEYSDSTKNDKMVKIKENLNKEI